MIMGVNRVVGRLKFTPNIFPLFQLKQISSFFLTGFVDCKDENRKL